MDTRRYQAYIQHRNAVFEARKTSAENPLQRNNEKMVRYSHKSSGYTQKETDEMTK